VVNLKRRVATFAQLQTDAQGNFSAKIREWYRSEVNDDWRGAADRIGPRAAAQEKVFTYPHGSMRLPGISAARSIRGRRCRAGVGRKRHEVENLDAIEGEILAATPRIWVVEWEESGHYEAPIRETFGERPLLERWYPYNLRVTLLGPL
jgi:hypothetical protein